MMNDRMKRLMKRIVKDSPRAREDYLAERQRLARKIRSMAERGEVAIVHGGIDCDGSRWDDRVAYVPALPVAVEKWLDDYNDGAEGPQWTSIWKPSEARELRSSSRDLVLEAYEDGHPHVIYY